jgi:hypothetical protein
MTKNERCGWNRTHAVHLDEIDWGDGAITRHRHCYGHRRRRHRRQRPNPRDISYDANVHHATVPSIVKPSPLKQIDLAGSTAISSPFKEMGAHWLHI